MSLYILHLPPTGDPDNPPSWPEVLSVLQVEITKERHAGLLIHCTVLGWPIPVNIIDQSRCVTAQLYQRQGPENVDTLLYGPPEYLKGYIEQVRHHWCRNTDPSFGHAHTSTITLRLVKP